MHKALPPSTFLNVDRIAKLAAAHEQVVVDLQHCDAVMTMVGMVCALYLGELRVICGLEWYTCRVATRVPHNV